MPRMINIATEAGDDVFVVQRISGREELGRMFEYSLELLSERADITAEQLLGTNVTVALELHDGVTPRYFNGYVTRFSVRGAVRTSAYKNNTGYLYLLTLNPGTWFATRTSNSQIYAQKAIGDLVYAQLNAIGLMGVDNQVGTTETRDFIVQYRETDFNFLSRMCEHAGIYYYFTHDNGTHKMVLVDQASKHVAIPDLAQISFAGEGRENTTISSFEMNSQVQAGAYALSDYNHVMPNTQIAAVSSSPKSHSNAGFEMFDHPADTTTASFATTYAQIRADEQACRYAVARGAGTERNIQVGFKTTLQDHSVAALNQEYMIVSHSFVATNNLNDGTGGDGSGFRCEFEAIPSAVQFRPARLIPRPSIAGTQTALVVADFTTDTDSGGGADPIGANMGRVKVEFFWDRYGKQSCWARVSQPWAGKGYGFQNMPRLGEEVLVQFLEGDPDRPIVIGRVYNAENMPPFKLPAGANYTGMKSLSIDGSGKSVAGKWNELRFDDNSGSEQIYVQAQKDYDRRVLNDEKVFVGNESHEVVTADTFKKHGADLHVQTTGDQNQKVGGSLSFNVTKDVHVKAASNILAEASTEVHVKGQKIVIEAATQLSLVVGGNFIDISAQGIAIVGMPFVKVNSGGSAGQGTACGPITAKDPKAAMTSEGGTPLVKPTPPTAPTAFSPQASSFQLAAVTGAPFVAPCAGC